MKRRTFILGAVAAAVSAALPGGKWETLAPGTWIVREDFGDIGDRYARALARSMMQTREVVAANVLNNIFPEYEYRTFHTGTLDEVISGEGARRSVGVEGSPDRI